MQEVQNYIAKKQEGHRNHLFFKELKKQENFFETMRFAERLTFWVMSFQDILRLIPPQIKNQALRRIANHHKAEDGGHNLWFLQDMRVLNENSQDLNTVEWLFSRKNEVVRDFSYKMISEVYNSTSDHQKITLILTLESGGHVFFEEISNFIKRKGYDDKLKYFSSYHLEVEQQHAVFEDKLMEELLNTKFTPSERTDNIKIVDHFYDGINSVFDKLYEEYLVKK